MRTGSSYAIQSEVPPPHIFTEWKVALMVLFRASPWASAPKGMREACLVTEQRLWRPEAAGVARKRSERRVQIHENNGSTPHLRVLRLHGGQCGPPPNSLSGTKGSKRGFFRRAPAPSGPQEGREGCRLADYRLYEADKVGAARKRCLHPSLSNSRFRRELGGGLLTVRGAAAACGDSCV